MFEKIFFVGEWVRPCAWQKPKNCENQKIGQGGAGKVLSVIIHLPFLITNVPVIGIMVNVYSGCCGLFDCPIAEEQQFYSALFAFLEKYTIN